MTASPPQIRIPATFMRGGTSKGVFFRRDDLPPAARVAGAARDALLLRVIGSPDPYGQHIDGLGGATSSTSKVVIVSPSARADHDIDYLFGQVAVDRPLVDWSGNCGNLSAAVGPFAISAGLVPASRVPREGIASLRIWQANIGRTILAQVPMSAGAVQETGDFELDGVTFAAAEVRLEFIDPAPAGEGGGLFPTGAVVDELDVPGHGPIAATLIDAGMPMIFIAAATLGLTGTESPREVNADPALLGRLEAIRAQGALRLRLIERLEDAAHRQHTPRVAFVAPPQAYVAANGRRVDAARIDLVVRAIAMGKVHHAIMGTGAVAIAAAAAVPGTLVQLATGGGSRARVRCGHPSGTLEVGADAALVDGRWVVTRAAMSRSARVLMEGWVRVPGDAF